MYANFFPGSMQEERSLTIDAEAGYALEDLEGFIRSIIDGHTSSLPIAEDGKEDDLASLISALEDGALLAEWFGDQDNEDETAEQRAQREAVEEAHDLLRQYKKQHTSSATALD